MSIGIHLLARPHFGGTYQAFLDQFLPEGEREWREVPGSTPAERLVEFAGRVCYLSFGSHQAPGTNADYIKKLIHHGHESVLEHATWTVLISGVSRAFSHQLVRHRVGFSFSQLSQQYHDESDVRFVLPHGIDQLPALFQVWESSTRNAREAYRKIIEELSSPTSTSEQLRALRSAARSVLPNASETAIVATINARALRHFLKLRGGIVGDPEMRCVCAALLEAIRPEGPAFFFDFLVQYPADGLPLVVHQSTL